MNSSTFLKVAGKKLTVPEEGTNMSLGLSALVREIQIDIGMIATAMIERDGYAFYLMYAENGTYFKYDGPGSEYRCFNLIIEDLTTGEVFLDRCLIYRGAKEAKKAIRTFRNRMLELTVSEIEEIKEKEINEYPWRCFTKDGSSVKSLTELEAQ